MRLLELFTEVQGLELGIAQYQLIHCAQQVDAFGSNHLANPVVLLINGNLFLLMQITAFGLVTQATSQAKIHASASVQPDNTWQAGKVSIPTMACTIV